MYGLHVGAAITAIARYKALVVFIYTELYANM